MRHVPLAVVFLLAIVIISGNASAKHVIKAYFNGQEATVSNVTLKVGEPFAVDLYVTPDRATTTVARLREPGGGEDAYRLIPGGSEEELVRMDGSPKQAIHFHWDVEPTGDWTDGTAPLDIQYDVWGEAESEDTQGYFTVVEAYITPERYKPPATSGSDPLALMASFIIALWLGSRH